MDKTLIALKGLSAIILSVTNLAVCATPLLIASLIRLALPITFVRNKTSKVTEAFARLYNHNNSCIFNAMSDIEWNVNFTGELSRNKSYFVTANHQSWADIPILQSVLEPNIPFLRFFIKQELIWVPILGVCWWALDFPFMKRYSKEYLKKHPEMKGQDIIETKRKCEHFKTYSVSVMNFLEGTRFTDQKKDRQNSPYKHLLKPRAGGAGLVLSSMGNQMHSILDVTIHYDAEGDITIWKLFSGQVNGIVINIRELEIPTEFKECNYELDNDIQSAMKDWINDIWNEKDRQLEGMKEQCEKQE